MEHSIVADMNLFSYSIGAKMPISFYGKELGYVVFAGFDQVSEVDCFNIRLYDFGFVGFFISLQECYLLAEIYLLYSTGQSYSSKLAREEPVC